MIEQSCTICGHVERIEVHGHLQCNFCGAPTPEGSCCEGAAQDNVVVVVEGGCVVDVQGLPKNLGYVIEFCIP